MNRRSGVVVASVLAGCALAGCTAEADVPEQPPVTGLLGALAGVRAAAGSTSYVEYGDVAAVRALVAADGQRFGGLAGYGYSDLAARAGKVAEVVGFDASAATSALRVGEPPTWAAVLRLDVDVAAVEGKLTALGGERDRSGTWTTAGDGEVVPGGPLAKTGVVSGFQQVRVEPGVVRHGTGGEALRWVADPGDRTLADDPMTGELARCLGDVVAAVITGPKAGLPLAAGVRATPAGEAVEVACVPDENPNALRDLVATNLETARTGRPEWPRLLPGAAAEQPADQTGVVRVVVPAGPGTRAGRVLQALQRGDLATLFS
ncbi:hypothetical protein [Saccharothrix longispora]|uniref:hypothetical protein n=1 Tax=Saccharothrix longispora TaxID=33920 RepID=UPI0028FDA0D4|nr:hypothetical protein [Saccharothrix longispora]MBY8847558.1 hypothetical protein [Saccharothrix sp. MB29]MDU0290554.1 hypothetical protein [Saccharothrix longispora]